MKAKLTLFGTFFFLMLSMGHTQENTVQEKVVTVKKKKKLSQSIISGNVRISKYHSREQLDAMSKGELLGLYIERIEVIINILPNIAFATKPGVTMKSLGIPETKDNKKALEDNIEATDNYFESAVEFQTKILPYSDTNDLIAAILFYESTLKALHTYNDFKED